MKNRFCLLLSAIAYLSTTQTAQAQIAPDGSTATQINGNAIAPTGSGTVNGGNLYHSFNEFNVPQSGVTFNTGNSSVKGAEVQNIINRVTGSNPSAVLGTIESRQAFPNANLYLMNPNGIVFGQNARLDIGGSFHATTGTGLGFDNGQIFNVDKNSLSFPSGDPKNIRFAISQPAGIINQGNLSVDTGKSITLTGGTVINTGTLTAPSGNVALTSVVGNSVVELRSPDAVLGLQVTANAIPSNWTGKITELPKLAELLTGKVPEANQVVVKADGSISLVANPTISDITVTNGMTIASGQINVSSLEAKGGNVGIFGEKVGLVNAKIDAFGLTGGGTVLIGGDFQGKGRVPNAQQTYVSANSIIDANALLNGNAGKVIVWSDQNTRFLGVIAAQGGTLSGNGGLVEVSGKENLIFDGKVDVRAANGKVGTLLLDPTDITISALADTPTINFAGGIFSDVTTSPSNLNVTTLQNQLALSNVTISTTSGLGGLGDISINTPINWSSANTLTLQANNDINLNAAISVTGIGNITLNAGGNFNGAAQTITASGGNISITTITGNITTGSVDTGVTNGTAGNITIQSGGNITTSSGFLNSRSGDNGNGGDILLKAVGDIITGDLFSEANSGGSPLSIGNSGKITLKTTGGSIDTSLGNITSQIGFGTGNGGDILLQATGNIITKAVLANSLSTSTGNGGNISLITTGGSINTLGGVYSYSDGGKGADILYQATGDITTSVNGVFSSSNGVGFNGGSISLFTTGGSINTSLSLIFSSTSVTANGGNIAIDAPSGNVTIGILDSSTTSTNPASTSGAIALNAGLNLAINGNVINTAVAGKVGDLTLSGNLALTANTTFSSNSGGTNGNLNLSNVNFTGNQTLTLDAGTGNISVGGIGSSSVPLTALNLIGANITLNRDIYTTNALTFGSPVTLANSLAITSGGNITFGSTVNGNQALSLNAGSNAISFNDIVGGTTPLASLVVNPASTITSTGAIDIRTIGTLNTGNITNTSRDITLKSSNAGITTGNITSAATSQNGGNIIVNAFSQITTGAIDSSSSTGIGGNINLDPIGDVTITSANTSGAIQGGSFSATSTGGNIRILGFVSSPFAACAGSSICTSGGTGGAISINHSGLNPFIVGDASINGSAGTITNGLYRLSLGQVIFNFPGTFRLDNISIAPGGTLPSTFTPVTLVSVPYSPFTSSPTILAIFTVDGTAILKSSIAQNEAYSSEKIALATTQHEQASESLKAGNVAEALVSLENSYTSEIEAFTGKPLTPSSSSTTGSDSGTTTSSTTGTTTTGTTTSSTTGTTTSSTTGTTTTGITTTSSDSSSNTSTTTGSTSSSETRTNNANANLQNTQKELNRVSQLTGSPTALVYPVIFNDRFEIVVILPNGKTIQKTITDSPKRVLLPVIKDFRAHLLDVRSDKYLIEAQKLHDWLIKPIESTLQAEKISTLVFVMDGDLRVIPSAALYDGKKFLIEKYAVASVPSFSLTKLEARDRKNSRVLAMGLTEPREGFSALPSVNAEIGNIVGTNNVQSLLSGISFINEPFTIPNMQAQRQQQDYGIIHLATHARFLTNSAYGSFIQFYNNRLYVSDIPDLNLNKPQVEILTLSACETAVGNNLGIAGLAVTSGVRSVLASLWPVSDTGTVPLMLSFYSQISAAPSKAIALQKAQLSLINGKVKIENDKIIGIPGIPAVPLPINSSINIKHPFFWSSFVLVGSWL